jgi:hypothetical protein
MSKRISSTLTPLAVAVLIGLFFALAAGCGDSSDSPGDVVRQIIEAYNNEDFGKVYDLSSAALQEQSGDRDTSIQMMASQWPPGTSITDLEITSEQIDGDRAAVGWKGTLHMSEVPDQPGDATVTLIKENGQWLLDQQASSAPSGP